MAKKKRKQNKDAVELLQTLTEQYEELKSLKVETKTNLSNTEKMLAKEQKAAQKEYGTDDPKKLEKILEELKAKNAEMLKEYEESLSKITTELDEIDQKYNDIAE